MKKCIFVLASASILLSGCYGPDSQLAGTMIGANLGGAIGSAIGGRSGGFAGDVFGTVIGTVAGAAIGNAVTSPPKEDETVNDSYTYSYQGYDATTQQRRPSYSVSNHQTIDSHLRAPRLSSLRVKNLRFIDSDRNRVINSDETCQLLFDICNYGDETLLNITPIVYELNRSKHIYISNPSVIHRIEPGRFVTYTIAIRTDRGLRNGRATFCIELSDGTESVACREFDIQTAR